MRVKAIVTLQVATDADLKDLLFQRNDDTLNTIIHDACNVQSSGVVRLAAAGAPPAGTPFNIPMGDVATGYILFLSTNKKITVKLDGGSTEHKIEPTGTYKGVLFMHGNFASAPVIENQEND